MNAVAGPETLRNLVLRGAVGAENVPLPNLLFDLNSSDCLTAALVYARLGWPVFPVRSDKKPFEAGGFHNATTDEEQIRTWWQRYPHANVAIANGGPAPVVLDVDVKDGKPGRESLAKLGPLPPTMHATTPSGGAHFYFVGPDVRRKSSFRPSLDLCGVGGYVVAAPSRTDAGVYRWSEGDAALATFPDTLRPTEPVGVATPRKAAATGDAEELAKRARAYLKKIGPAVSGEGGHQTAFNAARALAGFVEKGLPEDTGWGIFEAWNLTCQPPWSEKELRHKWDEAFTKAHTLPALEERSRPLTDLGNAERMHDAHGADLRVAKGLGRLVWTGKIWEPDDTHEWDRRAQDTVRGLYKAAGDIEDEAFRKATSAWARKSESRDKLAAMCSLVETLPRVAITTEDLDSDLWLLNVENGTIDLRTGTLHEHRREDLITKIAGCAYDPDATAPTFDRFLITTFEGDAELIAFLRRFVGYCLTGSVKEQVLAFFYGEGANGKSTLIALMTDLLGGVRGYAAPAAPGLLVARHGESHPTELADLRGRRLVSCVEIGDGKRFNEERVKALTGGDNVKARMMREDFFDFTPSHKLVIAANHKPTVRGADLGIWRRFLLVPFLVTFTDAQKDRDLPAKLRAELPGVLAWAVRGCLEWQSTGLKPPAKVQGATEAYRAEQDVVGRFVADRCEKSPEAWVATGTLYETFKRWCTEQGEHPPPQRRFSERLAKEAGLEDGRRGKDRTRSWRGLRLLASPGFAALGGQ
jgi:putative DNA primase/helicase